MREASNPTTFIPITVQPLAFISNLGTSPAEIYINVETQLTTPTQLTMKSIDCDTQIASNVYGAAAIEHNGSYIQRLHQLFDLSFAQAVHALQPHLSGLLVLIQLPATKTARAEYLSYTDIETKIHSAAAPWDKIAIKFIESDDALNVASQILLQRPELMAVIVGAVDSFFDPETITELAENNELKTEHHKDGTALGEAAGWLLVSRTVKKAPLIIQQYATANDAHALVSATQLLKIDLKPDILIKLYGDTQHQLNQQHEINLRFLSKNLNTLPGKNNVQRVDFSALSGILGSASIVMALAYLAGRSEVNLIPWETALILHCDSDSQQVHSFLISKGNTHEHDNL